MNQVTTATSLLLLSAIALWLWQSGCAYRSAPGAVSINVVKASVLTANVLDGRVDAYDTSLDYFPDKVVFRHATQIKLEYRGHYKFVTFTPNVNGDVIRYVLVQRGTPVPDLPDIHHPLTHVFEVPLERVALGTMRYGGAADLLDVQDRLSLVSGLRSITTPSILTNIKAGKTSEAYSTEQQLDRNVDAAMGYYSSQGEALAMMKDRELGVNRVGMAEHLEPTPLANGSSSSRSFSTAKKVPTKSSLRSNEATTKPKRRCRRNWPTSATARKCWSIIAAATSGKYLAD